MPVETRSKNQIWGTNVNFDGKVNRNEDASKTQTRTVENRVRRNERNASKEEIKTW